MLAQAIATIRAVPRFWTGLIDTQFLPLVVSHRKISSGKVPEVFTEI